MLISLNNATKSIVKDKIWDDDTIDCIRTLLEKNAEVTNQDLQLVQESHNLMLFDLFEEFGYDLSAPITVDTV